MAEKYTDIFAALSDLTLWYKVRDSDAYVLADIPSIIPLRWGYFRDKWDFIKEDLIKSNQRDNSSDPDKFTNEVDRLTSFIEAQRSASSKLNPFDNVNIQTRFYNIFNQILISSLETSKEEDRIIQEEEDRMEFFTRDNFVAIRTILQERRDILTDRVGLSDDDYNRVYNRSPAPKQNTVKLADINNMKRIMDSIDSVEFIIANSYSLEPDLIDPFSIARSNANNPEFDIDAYRSGFLVKLDYGESLQALGTRYLGNPDKWIDIAIANGLKAPYIDEVGQRLEMLSNAGPNQVNIGSTDTAGILNLDKFFIGQTIQLKSNTFRFTEQRVVLNVKSVPISGEIILELDGASDLDKYKIDEDAHIRVFKPNTINSNFFILIPSLEERANEDIKQETPFFLTNSAEDEKNQGVDLSLSDTADLQFTSTDDLSLSFGLSNSIQAIQLKMSIEANSLDKHPTFGLVNVAGESNVDLATIKSSIINSIVEQIGGDDRFDRIERLGIENLTSIGGSANAASGFTIELSVRLAGSDTVLPISFTISK